MALTKQGRSRACAVQNEIRMGRVRDSVEIRSPLVPSDLCAAQPQALDLGMRHEPILHLSVWRPHSGPRRHGRFGPTNTGKTHLAIERLLAHEVGIIGLPLRLLAREVYDKIVARIGTGQVALITGEEKIKPPSPLFYVCTVEAMPLDLEADFVAIDEIQLAADGERGHVFTERLFHARGSSETLLLGAATMRDAIRELLPAAQYRLAAASLQVLLCRRQENHAASSPFRHRRLFGQ